MIFWTENDYFAARRRLSSGVIIYAVCACAYVIVSVTLLFLSKGRDYTFFLLGDIALAVAFGLMTVWYFCNPFRDAKNLVALYDKMSRATKYVETGKIVKIEPITKEGLDTYELTLVSGDEERSVNVFIKDINNFFVGETCTVKIRANFVTAKGDKDER